jgi:SAM-dependent methyltransferase
METQIKNQYNIDWSIFDKQYPLEDGIVNALPEQLRYHVDVKSDAKHFFDVHGEVMQNHKNADFLHDKQEMARMQKDFYDRMASGFQSMDDTDEASGGVFGWKVKRCALYDSRHFKKPRVLFIGAGNCRVARIFAQQGFSVVATDISINMLKIGKQINDELGLPMTYVAQNAEISFPFKSETFDSVYSLCVMNHITDWNNYISEKIRCLKYGGVFLERMPNALLWDFWKLQGELYEGVEIKAKYCTPVTAREKLDELKLKGKIWTHDHQVDIISKNVNWFLRQAPLVKHVLIPRYIKAARISYNIRTMPEDRLGVGKGNNKGIYTMIKIVKKANLKQ